MPVGDDQPAEPATTVIELSRAGLLGLLVGADTHHIADHGDLRIRGDQPAASTLLATITGPDVLAALTAART